MNSDAQEEKQTEKSRLKVDSLKAIRKCQKHLETVGPIYPPRLEGLGLRFAFSLTAFSLSTCSYALSLTA